MILKGFLNQASMLNDQPDNSVPDVNSPDINVTIISIVVFASSMVIFSIAACRNARLLQMLRHCHSGASFRTTDLSEIAHQYISGLQMCLQVRLLILRLLFMFSRGKARTSQLKTKKQGKSLFQSATQLIGVITRFYGKLSYSYTEH